MTDLSDLPGANKISFVNLSASLQCGVTSRILHAGRAYSDRSGRLSFPEMNRSSPVGTNYGLKVCLLLAG